MRARTRTSAISPALSGGSPTDPDDDIPCGTPRDRERRARGERSRRPGFRKGPATCVAEPDLRTDARSRRIEHDLLHAHAPAGVEDEPDTGLEEMGVALGPPGRVPPAVDRERGILVPLPPVTLRIERPGGREVDEPGGLGRRHRLRVRRRRQFRRHRRRGRIVPTQAPCDRDPEADDEECQRSAGDEPSDVGRARRRHDPSLRTIVAYAQLRGVRNGLPGGCRPSRRPSSADHRVGRARDRRAGSLRP